MNFCRFVEKASDGLEICNSFMLLLMLTNVYSACRGRYIDSSSEIWNCFTTKDNWGFSVGKSARMCSHDILEKLDSQTSKCMCTVPLFCNSKLWILQWMSDTELMLNEIGVSTIVDYHFHIDNHTLSVQGHVQNAVSRSKNFPLAAAALHAWAVPASVAVWSSIKTVILL